MISSDVVRVTAKHRPAAPSHWVRTLMNAPEVTMLPSQQRRDIATPELVYPKPSAK